MNYTGTESSVRLTLADALADTAGTPRPDNPSPGLGAADIAKPSSSNPAAREKKKRKAKIAAKSRRINRA